MPDSRPFRLSHARIASTFVLALVWVTLLVSAIRGLGHSAYGPFPALGALEALKFLDPVLTLVTLAVLVGLPRRGRDSSVAQVWPRFVLGACGLVGVIAAIGALVWSVPPYYAVQAVYFLVRPFLVLVIFALVVEHAPDFQAPWRAWKAFSVINAALVLGAYAAARAQGPVASADMFIGLLNDAHQQATFSYTMVLVLIGLGPVATSVRARLWWTGLIALNLAAGYASQGQKATGVLVAVLLAAGVVRILQSRSRLARVAAVAPWALSAAILLGVSAVGITLWMGTVSVVTGNLMARLADERGRDLDLVRNIGAVAMIRDYVAVTDDLPLVLAIGAGPASFGSPAALTRMSRGEGDARLSDVFWRDTAAERELVRSDELRLLGLSTRTGVIGIALGEYGPLGLLTFLTLVGMPLLLRVHHGADAVTRRAFYWVRLAYLAILLQSIISTLGAWDNDVTMTLIAAGLATGVVARTTDESRQVLRTEETRR